MQLRILKTDNGTHPPEKWALHTADAVFDISSIADSERVILARRAHADIAAALHAVYVRVQNEEKAALQSGTHSELHVQADADEALAGLLDAVKGTPWEEHYACENVQQAAMVEIVHHLATIRHIEHRQHDDNQRKAR